MDLAGALFDDPELEIDVVTDGRSVLDRLALAPRAYDLVVLGYNLPEISGADCIRFIRKMFARLPILVLSDVADEARLKALATLGVRRQHILQKPAEPAAFAARVQQALQENKR